MWGKKTLQGLFIFIFMLGGGDKMENPIKTIKMKNNWTIQELASVADVSENTAYNCLHGITQKINANILKAMIDLGYDSEKIKKEYNDFRAAKQQELLQEAK